MEFPHRKNCREPVVAQEKREAEDYLYIAVEYVLHPDTTYEIFLGFIDKSSVSGPCLYTAKFLEKGQQIIIKSSYPPHSQKAIVCWTEQYDSIYYRIGIESVK